MTKFILPAFLLVCLLNGAAAQVPTPATPPPPAPVGFYRSNLGHTGVSEEAITAPLSLVWRHTTQFAKNNPASPVYANSTVFFVSGGFVYAVNTADGTTKWQYPADGKAVTYFATTPALDGGAVYITDDNGMAYKLDGATGRSLWKARLDGAIRSAPVVSGSVVYFGSGNAHCYALSAESGQVLWDQPTDGPVTTSPTITGGLAVFASSDNNVYSLSGRTGRKAWAVGFDVDPSVLPVVYDGATLYVTAGDTVYGLNPSNGTRRSRLTLPTNILQPPTVSSNGMYVITQMNVLYGLTLAGKERWHITLAGSATAPPLLAGNQIFIATQPGILSAYETGNGNFLWQYVMQATATDSQPKYSYTNVYGAPILAGGTLYAVSDDGTLSAFRANARDTIGPQLTQLVPDRGATVPAANLTYGALLVDDGSGINPATVSLSLDGQTDTNALYRAGENAIYNTPAEPLKEGSHSLVVKATDWRGNATKQSWSFLVQNRPTRPGESRRPGGPYPGRPSYPGQPPYPGGPNYPGGRNPNAPPPPPPIVPF